MYHICGTSGHVANTCYYRFDKDFIPFQRQMGSNYPQQQTYNRGSSYAPVAAVATKNSESVPEEWWFPNSGATHHVTNDLTNLSLGNEYFGGGKVHG